MMSNKNSDMTRLFPYINLAFISETEFKIVKQNKVSFIYNVIRYEV